MKTLIRTVLAAIALTGLNAFAQSPAASSGVPLKLIVPFTAGTGIDIVARTVGPRLSQRLGRPVVVENRTGASGNIGTEAVVRAPADGNTLLVSVNTLVMNRSLYAHLPFDPVKDLVPVSLTSWGQLLLVAPPSTGFHSARDLVEAAKARPGRLNYASPGVGTPHHMSMELFKQTAGVYLTHIPYRGTAPAVTDLLGGQVDAMFLPIHVALPHVRSGKLKALAVTGAKRSAATPEFPTMQEAGVPGFVVESWYGLMAPAGTPDAVIARLHKEVLAVLATPEVREFFAKQGADVVTSSPAEFAAMVKTERARWAEVIRASGAKVD
jgi:tripartite-type tricarboxylate transporter receptor subunit TctC